MTVSALALFVRETAASLLDTGLDIARALGLPVDSWQPGDPTRSLYHWVAQQLATLEEVNAEHAKSSYLSTAEGDWKTLHAHETYNVTRNQATRATPTVTLSNTGGGLYVIDPGDLVVKSSVSGATFTNTSAGTLAAGDTETFDLVADEEGSDSNVGVDEIDEFVTTFNGVVIVSSTAALAIDAESDPSLQTRCEASTAALSPNGPDDAYVFVATTPEYTGVQDVTRATAIGDADTGDVTLYVASATGAVAGASLTAVEDAIELWATPKCITPTVVQATLVGVAVTVTVEGENLPANVADLIEAAIIAQLATHSISDGTGYVSRSSLIATIHGASSAITRITLSVPSADVTLTAGQVPIPGVVSVIEA